MGIYTVKRILLDYLDANLIPEIEKEVLEHGLDPGAIINPTAILEYFTEQSNLNFVQVVYMSLLSDYTIGDLGEVACSVTKEHNIEIRLISTHSDKQIVSDQIDIWADSLFQILFDNPTLNNDVRQTLIVGIDYTDFMTADETKTIRRQAVVSIIIKER